MASQEIEIILSRQLADCLTIPIFLTDTRGDLLFYNMAAEQILGKRFEDTGPMSVEEWSKIFNPQDAEGNPLPPSELPLVKTLSKQIPEQGSFWIKNLQGDKYHLSVTSFPIIGQSGRYLGAMAIFWKNQ